MKHLQWTRQTDVDDFILPVRQQKCCSWKPLAIGTKKAIFVYTVRNWLAIGVFARFFPPSLHHIIWSRHHHRIGSKSVLAQTHITHPGDVGWKKSPQIFVKINFGTGCAVVSRQTGRQGLCPRTHHHGDSCVREGTMRCRLRRRRWISTGGVRCAYFLCRPFRSRAQHKTFGLCIFILSAIWKLCALREWESNFNYTTRRCCWCVWFC